ncbi:hypothetical protein CPB84DRAFT_1759191, partial [Gymnopilus junonius]
GSLLSSNVIHTILNTSSSDVVLLISNIDPVDCMDFHCSLSTRGAAEDCVN